MSYDEKVIEKYGRNGVEILVDGSLSSPRIILRDGKYTSQLIIPDEMNNNAMNMLRKFCAGREVKQ